MGVLPDILLDTDPRPVKEQLAERYRHGGGYSPFKGFKLIDRATMALQYPGDPTMWPGAMSELGDETVYYYPHGSWLLIMQKDGTWEVCRVD